MPAVPQPIMMRRGSVDNIVYVLGRMEAILDKEDDEKEDIVCSRSWT
jgi:hypothetical protein